MSTENPYAAYEPSKIEAADLTRGETADNRVEESGPINTAPEPYAMPAGSVKDVLAWIGDDHSKARFVLETESAKDSPRRTLVNELNDLLAG